jgi:hypothetical protein
MAAEAARHDPKIRRSIHGFADMAYLVAHNGGPLEDDYHRVIVSKLDRTALNWYEAMGYEYARYEANGPRPRGVPPTELEKLVKQRALIETLDGFVMAIHKDALAAVRAPGFKRMNDIDRMMSPRSGKPSAMNPLAEMDPRDRRYFELEEYGKREGSGLQHGDDRVEEI